MVSIFDTFLLSDDICELIKSKYADKVDLVEMVNGRRQKNYHEHNTSSWIHEIASDLIYKNLGHQFKLIDRVTILRYDIGDYFIEHVDGPGNLKLNNKLPFHFYGGVELSERSEFIGGEFYINGKNVDYKKGRMFTHGFYDRHGVKKIEKGTRWSIHFLIKKEIKNGIL
jgi:hypothetical protein